MTNNVKVEIANLDNFLKESTEMTFNLEAKSMYTFKGSRYDWMNEKTAAKYPKLCEATEPILPAFPICIISKQIEKHFEDLTAYHHIPIHQPET